MPPTPPLGWWRLGVLALGVLALSLGFWLTSHRRPPDGPRVIDASDLVADPDGHGTEVVVAGEWTSAGPLVAGRMAVVIRGARGGLVLCYFEIEGEPAAASRWIQALPERVQIFGHRDGIEDGLVVLRGCRLVE